MRLSLRTLLAFEDNVFDVEQHRRLEQLLPTDPNAELSLQRIRSVVRNPGLGVPGLVDHQEELDPNYVAEYLDHQMPVSVQDRFESYCFSADKYLAEVASVHHILSNVLGEPARTSRECRLKCYDVLSADKKSPVTEMKNSSFSDSEQPRHFRPFGQQKPNTVKPVTNRYFALWNLLFSSKTGQNKTEQPVPTEQKSSLWTFVIIGLCVCTFLLGWQQIEKQRLAQKLREVTETEIIVAENIVTENKDDEMSAIVPTDQHTEITGQSAFAVPPEPFTSLEPLESIKQTALTTELPGVSSRTSSVTPTDDPFLAVAELPPAEFAGLEPISPDLVSSNKTTPETAPVDSVPQVTVTSSKETEKIPVESTDSIITFQPITAKQQADHILMKGPSENPIRPNLRPPLPASAWQSQEMPVKSTPVPAAPVWQSQPIMQTSGTGAAPRILGRAVPMSLPSVIFSATTSEAPWQLPPLPFDLNGEQYLLTVTPFRGTFELAADFRIEMIGDVKLCILPLDAEGVPGIFVDYGRIIIYPLQPDQPLRIETEKSRGIVSSSGTNSILFVDTFAEISDPATNTRLAEEHKPKTSPILGCVPKNGERIIWKSINQQRPFFVDTQGSVLLQADQYRFGEVRNLPNWLGTMPMPQEDRMLAEACRRCFGDAHGNGEEALTWLIQDQSRTVRTLGFRLWGDLGRFDVPLAVMAAKRKEDDAVRQVLVYYFKEVMRRDAETIQRFADAIEIVKEARR